MKMIEVSYSYLHVMLTIPYLGVTKVWRQYDETTTYNSQRWRWLEKVGQRGILVFDVLGECGFHKMNTLVSSQPQRQMCVAGKD